MERKEPTMKIAALILLAFFFTIAGMAQPTKKVIAVINRADWCHVCQANGEKMMKEVMPVFKDSDIRFIMNDLTNDETKNTSKMVLEENKVYEAVKKIKSTGMLLLVDELTGKLIDKISLAEPVDKLLDAIRKSFGS